VELENRTGWPAALFRAPLEDPRFAAALVARVTFQLTPAGPQPSSDQPWIVSRGPWISPQGPVDGDALFRRGGVDLFLFGTARIPGRPLAETFVDLQAGGFRRRVRVVGDRSWVRRRGTLAPTAPLPFNEMPLSLARAYGGKTLWDALEIAHPDNPAGRGFVLEEAAAQGAALPNLEDPDRPIRSWDDRPEPVGLGFCPMTCGARLRNGLVVGEGGELHGIRSTLFNAAFPAMIAERVAAGDGVQISGVTDSGAPLAFRVPELPLVAELRFGEEVIQRPLAIDQLGIEADAQRLFITYRYPFRYVMHPRQVRSCRLLVGGGI
jgi:hypothetical protein